MVKRPKIEQQRKLARNQRPIPQLHALQLFRVGRLAQLFDVDPSTIWRWKRDGKLPPFKEVCGIEGLTGQQVMTLLKVETEEDGEAA